MAPIKGFHKAADVALFVLVIGGFLAITMRTGAMNAGVAAVVILVIRAARSSSRHQRAGMPWFITPGPLVRKGIRADREDST